MAYGGFRNLTRITSDEILRNKAFDIAKNSTNDRYQRGLASIIYKFLDKRTSGCGIKIENMSDSN